MCFVRGGGESLQGKQEVELTIFGQILTVR